MGGILSRGPLGIPETINRPVVRPGIPGQFPLQPPIYESPIPRTPPTPIGAGGTVALGQIAVVAIAEISSNETGDTRYTKNFTANILIFHKKGKQLMATKYQVPKTTILSNKVDQQYITLPTLILNIPPGDYEVRYFIIDNISGKNFEINKNIRIAPQMQAFVD